MGCSDEKIQSEREQVALAAGRRSYLGMYLSAALRAGESVEATYRFVLGQKGSILALSKMS